MGKIINQLWTFHYSLGVLKNQLNDPLCKNCLSFAKSLEILKERFIAFEKISSSEREKLPDEYSEIFTRLYSFMGSTPAPDNPVGQKKAGNCKLPEGVCFPKYTLAFLVSIGG